MGPATDLVARHGTTAVLCRMLPFVRTVMPASPALPTCPTGASCPPPSVGGALAWASAWVVAGSAIAASGVLDHLGTAVSSSPRRSPSSWPHAMSYAGAARPVRTLAHPWPPWPPVAAVAVPAGGPVDRESTGAHLTGGHPDGGEPGSEELPGSRRPRCRDRLPVC